LGSDVDVGVNEGWIAVGRLIRARGIRGELIGEIYSSQPGRAEKLNSVMLVVGDRQRTAEIERIWHHDGRPVFKFAGIDSMSDAEAWAGADVLVAPDELAAPEAGEYSHADLIGCKVVAWSEIATSDGQSIGIVTGVQDFGSAPLLVIEGEGGHEILVPFARAICREIDVKAKIIRAKLPEGLLDL
jgi:16S rRNA processing protein RimM